jgi:hypothetical protein
MTAAPRPDEPHPELDTLADLDAGLLEGSDAERIAGHVAGCARCGHVMAALGGVRADLRTLSAPPLPAAVAARLDATLAELRTAPDGAAPDRTDRTDRTEAAAATAQVTDLGAARQRRWRRLKAAGSGVAAALVLVVAGTSVVSLVRSAGGDDSMSAAGGGSAEEQVTREQQDSAAAPGAAAPTSLPPLPDFDAASLRAALPTLVTANGVGRVAETDAAGPAGAMADSALRTACARTIPGAKGKLSAVLWIRYGGRPAYAFVFSDAGVRTAYVVGDQCGRVSAVPATLLDTVR